MAPKTPGSLGTVLTETGVHFSLYSENATRVELCLFDAIDAVLESQRIPLENHTDHIWRVHVPIQAPAASMVTGCTVPTIRQTDTGSIRPNW